MAIRNSLIDFLRGLAILAMILIHTTVFFYSDPIAATLWNWSQLAVPIFLFCSAYLFVKKDMQHEIRLFSYFKKRIMRLLIPYYIFLLLFIPLVFVLNQDKVSLQYILESIFLIGGVDINWLILLFLMIAILFPFFQWASQKNRFLFWGFFSISLISSIVFLFWIPPISYKLILWLPWSLIFFFAYWFHKHEQHKKHLLSAFLFFSVLGIATYFNNIFLGESVMFRENKYPPNLFYLSFGMAGILLLSFLANPLTQNKLVRKSIHFFSIYSYDIYFTHYIILTIFVAFLPQLHWSWWILFLVVLVFSIFVQFLLNSLRKYNKRGLLFKHQKK